jgi:hypothetical protein
MQINKTFWQTISPFNKNKDGSLKTKEQILEEENRNAKKWLLEPLHHIKCK